MFIVLYADDILITCNSLASITAMKINLHVNFLMSDLGLLDYFLMIEITQCDSRITMAQSYATVPPSLEVMLVVRV
jgi:hypothetical protein